MEKIESAMLQCTGSKSPRRKLGGAPIKLWGVMHDQSTGCALATDGCILAVVPSLYDPDKGAATKPDDIPNWKRCIPKCSGTPWRVDEARLKAGVDRALRCASAIMTLGCVVRIRFGSREVMINAEYLKRAFCVSDAVGVPLELRADEMVSGPAFMETERCTIAILPLTKLHGDINEFVVLDETGRVVAMPKPLCTPEEARTERDVLAHCMARTSELLAKQPGNPELQRELKKFARRAAALAAEDSARKELEEMKGEGK